MELTRTLVSLYMKVWEEERNMILCYYGRAGYLDNDLVSTHLVKDNWSKDTQSSQLV